MFREGCKGRGYCRIMPLHCPRLLTIRSENLKGDAPVKTSLRIATLAALSVLIIVGCTQTKVSRTSQQEAQKPPQQDMTREQMQMLREILEYQKESGQELLAVLKDLEKQKSADERPQEHPVVQNIPVARQIVSRAMETEDRKKLASLLHRLRFVLTDTYAQLPASRMIAHLERARTALGEGEPTDEQISAASREVMAALETGMGVEPADFVPPILTKLESAKKKLDSDNAAAARMQIIEAQRQAADHKLNGVMRRAIAAARGAEEALHRQADTVVNAELSVVESMLDEVYSVAGSAEKKEQAEPEQPAEQTEQTEGEQTESGEETSASEQSTTEEPADTDQHTEDQPAAGAEQEQPQEPTSRSATYR